VQDSIESNADGGEQPDANSTFQAAQNGEAQDDSENGPQEVDADGKQDPNAEWNMNGSQQQMFNGGFGFDPSQAGFGGMDWNQNGSFNSMMQMPINGNWNGFQNMMGMFA